MIDPCIIVCNKATYQPGYLLLTITSEKNKPLLRLNHYTRLALFITTALPNLTITFLIKQIPN